MFEEANQILLFELCVLNGFYMDELVLYNDDIPVGFLVAVAGMANISQLKIAVFAD